MFHFYCRYQILWSVKSQTSLPKIIYCDGPGAPRTNTQASTSKTSPNRGGTVWHFRPSYTETGPIFSISDRQDSKDQGNEWKVPFTSPKKSMVSRGCQTQKVSTHLQQLNLIVQHFKNSFIQLTLYCFILVTNVVCTKQAPIVISSSRCRHPQPRRKISHHLHLLPPRSIPGSAIDSPSFRFWRPTTRPGIPRNRVFSPHVDQRKILTHGRSQFPTHFNRNEKIGL